MANNKLVEKVKKAKELFGNIRTTYISYVKRRREDFQHGVKTRTEENLYGLYIKNPD